MSGNEEGPGFPGPSSDEGSLLEESVPPYAAQDNTGEEDNPYRAMEQKRSHQRAFSGKSTSRRRRGPITRKLAKIDTIHSLFIRDRDKTCQARIARECSGAERLQAAHILPRGYKHVRYDPGNAVALCWRCHGYFTHRPVEWTLWVMKRLGQAGYTALLNRANQQKTYRIDDDPHIPPLIAWHEQRKGGRWAASS